jgi:hypothetical protein
VWCYENSPQNIAGSFQETPMRSLVGLVMTLLIVFVGYKLVFTQLQSTGSAAPARSIDVAGVKGDLISIAQAERIYQAQQNTYGTLDQLTSSGAMSMIKTGRDGYTYEAEASASSFRVVAHCPAAANPGCSNYAIDDTMEVRATP